MQRGRRLGIEQEERKQEEREKKRTHVLSYVYTVPTNESSNSFVTLLVDAEHSLSDRFTVRYIVSFEC